MKARKDKQSIRVIAISQFKAKCLSLLEEVEKTKAPLRVTKRGKAIADVVPPSPETVHADWLGSMSNSTEITGDIVSPVIEVAEIEALKN
ncbi:MAG TPA: type II toxin-antitoxin system prevent-host-death family antitoxin [Candidatus Acidoferrales bacterium]|nr:type II toxin-antitoxin system prevent-host-death family antitoxin [Candidatus Acidoferrales bacterium]